MKMTDNIAEQENENTTKQGQEQELDYKALYEEAKKSIDALAAKKEELLRETKAAKEEKRKAAEMAEKTKQEQLLKNQEYEKLWKQEQEEKERIKQELLKDRQERRNEKIGVAALRVATDLTKGDIARAELLEPFIQRTLSNVADDFGNVENDVLLSVKKQFETDVKYAPLIAVNKSVGGGATGNPRSAGDKQKTLERADFEKLTQHERAKFFKEGGKLI